MSIEATHKTESDLLGCCLLDGATIDRALQQGITPGHFSHVHHAGLWRLLCELRLAGKDTTAEGVFAAVASDKRRTEAVGGMGAVVAHQSATTAHANSLISSLIEIHGKREGWRVLSKGLEGLKSGSASLEDLAGFADELKAVSSRQQSVQRQLGDIAEDAIKDAQEQIEGRQTAKTLVTTGLPNFDRWATPMGPEEVVVVGGRTSAGKSSLMLQIAGHNLAKGLRVAVFSLETSDDVVLRQLVGQRAGVNIRDLKGEMPAKQQEYLEKLRFAKTTKNLMIFDRDISLTAIQARCRLLATSFKPQLVVIDYLNIIGAEGDSYEKTSRISNSLIEIRKGLGCTLMVGAQLNRSSEREEREPNRTDYRDSGSVEQDAHRLLAIWRKPNQPLDLNYYECSLLQLKHRSGPLAKVDCRFNARHTTFIEAALN